MERTSVIDFIVYICSCIGIWFGISVYTFFDFITGKFEQRNVAHTLASARTIRELEIKMNEEFNQQKKHYDKTIRSLFVKIYLLERNARWIKG